MSCWCEDVLNIGRACAVRATAACARMWLGRWIRQFLSKFKSTFKQLACGQRGNDSTYAAPMSGEQCTAMSRPITGEQSNMEIDIDKGQSACPSNVFRHSPAATSQSFRISSVVTFAIQKTIPHTPNDYYAVCAM